MSNREGICTYCLEYVSISNDGRVNIHSWPRPTRQICRGSNGYHFWEMVRSNLHLFYIDLENPNAFFTGRLYQDFLCREYFSREGKMPLMRFRINNAKYNDKRYALSHREIVELFIKDKYSNSYFIYYYGRELTDQTTRYFVRPGDVHEILFDLNLIANN